MVQGTRHTVQGLDSNEDAFFFIPYTLYLGSMTHKYAGF